MALPVQMALGSPTLRLWGCKMADKNYKLVFTMSDNTTKEVEFTVP